MSTNTTTNIPITREFSNTNNMKDYEIAKQFYDDFDVANNFGILIPNDDFNTWIQIQGFKNMTHDWNTRNGRNAWNGHRNTVRTYIKNGVLTEEYAATGYKPYSLEVKEHGQSLIITRFEDVVIDGYSSLADKRKKTIKYQSKILNKNFKAMTRLYKMDRIEAIMQANIVDAQNQMRFAFEESCGKILNTTVANTMKSIAASERAVKQITDNLFSTDEDDDQQDRAA